MQDGFAPKMQISMNSARQIDDTVVEIRVKVVEKEAIVITFAKSGKKIIYGIFPLNLGKKPPEGWGVTPRLREGGGYSISQDDVLIYPSKREAVESVLMAGVVLVT